MIYTWFTGINYYKLAVEKDHDSIFTTIWKPGYWAGSWTSMDLSLVGPNIKAKRVIGLCHITLWNFCENEHSSIQNMRVAS